MIAAASASWEPAASQDPIEAEARPVPLQERFIFEIQLVSSIDMHATMKTTARATASRHPS